MCVLFYFRKARREGNFIIQHKAANRGLFHTTRLFTHYVLHGDTIPLQAKAHMNAPVSSWIFWNHICVLKQAKSIARSLYCTCVRTTVVRTQGPYILSSSRMTG